MKEFINKYKKVLIIVLIVLLLVATGLAVYFLVIKDDNNIDGNELVNNNDQAIEQEDTVPEDSTVFTPPDYVEVSSSEAIDATAVAAKEWASDAKLYNCSGLPTSVSYEETTFDYIGTESGKYWRWNCTYYSKSKAETKIYIYDENGVDGNAEAVAIGEHGELMYDAIDYPEDLGGIVDSTEVYATALEQGLNKENYVNMYLTDVGDYGFVWQLEERSKTEKDESDIGVLLNTYIFDIYTGELKDKVQEEVN
jgi:hypothetical protein